MQEEVQHSLQNGSILNQYKIIRILGEGGFGITYLAEDIQLGLRVVIKEYFPNEFAIRSGDSTITSKSKSKNDFNKGMQRFKEEAKTLAKFKHPSIVKILGYFEANDTAYFVMEYEEGVDLSQHLNQLNKSMTQDDILSIMMPILEGLKEVHKYNYLHRDIKPGNILLRTNKSPILIDFGASKLAIGEASKSITSMLTDGYAPLEQYSTDIKKQGAFTDLYAVAAVIYKIIIGKIPPSAQTRSYAILSGEGDTYEALSILQPKGYDISFLKAVDRALLLNAKERPQSVDEFQKDMLGIFAHENEKIISGIDSQIVKEENNSRLIIIFSVIAIILVSVLGYIVFNSDEKIQSSEILINKDEIIEPKKEEISTKTTLAQSRQHNTNELKEVQAETARLKKELEELEYAKLEKVRLELEKKKRENIARELEQEQERLRIEKLRQEKEVKRLIAEYKKKELLSQKKGPLYKVINVSRNDTLNVRTNPYVTSNNKIGELQPYTSGFYVVKTTVNYKGVRWAYINYNGLIGWVIARSIEEVGASSYRKKTIPKKKTYTKKRKSTSSRVWYCKAKSERASGWVRKVGKQNAINGAIRQCNNRRQTSSRCRIIDCHIVR